LDGKPNPTYRSEGRYWLAIEQQIEACSASQSRQPHP
jgi:hypothetical protein